MPFSLIPDLVLPHYEFVTPRLLHAQGVRLLLCDLDYTLAPKSVSRPDNRLRHWLKGLKDAGITVMILSNNRSSGRVETFCRDLGIPYVGHAGKPRRRGFLTAMTRAGVSPAQTAMLGDKLLTDVLGARRSGVLALMVEPLDGPRGLWNHILHGLQRPFKYAANRKSPCGTSAHADSAKST